MSLEIEKKLKKIVKNDSPKSILFEGKKIYISKNKINELKPGLEGYREKKEGGVLPLLALLPAIIAGLSGAAGISAGIANTIKSSKEAQKVELEKEKLKKEIDNIPKPNTSSAPISGGSATSGTASAGDKPSGKGLFLDPYQGRGIYDFLKHSTGEKFPGFKDKGIRIHKQGNGVFLDPL